MNIGIASRLTPALVLWGVGLFVGFISLLLILSRVDTHLRNTAINECASISQFSEVVDEQRKVVYPVQDIYEACLKKKGL